VTFIPSCIAFPMSSPHATPTAPVGFGRRLLATLIDSALGLALIWAIFGDPASLTRETQFVLNWVLPAMTTVLLWTLWQATPGKMLLGVRIVDAETGGAPTLGQYVFRYLGYFAAILPLGLGLLWIFFDRRKRGLHDIMAGTMVVRTVPMEAPSPRAHAASATLTRGAALPAPRVFPGGFGPWGSPAAAENHASLVWIRDDVLHLAVVNRENHPGAAAAVTSGVGFPARQVPLGALHSLAAPDDGAEAEVIFAVEDGTCETWIASLGSRGERDELFSALMTRLGGGWARIVEQEARGPLLWGALKGAGSILLIAVFVLYVVKTGDAEPMKELDGSSGLTLIVLTLLGMLVGAQWVGIVASVLIGLCVLYMIAVTAAPPKRVALRRVASVGVSAGRDAERYPAFG
jgi:uncharacterized RDD family membrane protein YckC